MKDIKLINIVELSFLQELQDAFAEAMGIACIIIDKEGNTLTSPSQFTDFCFKYNRGCKKGNDRCIRSDLRGAEKSALTGKPTIYKCENGLVDFATPIMLGDTQIGAFLGGQVLCEEYDELVYVNIAEEIGIDSKEYIEALKLVPIIPMHRIESAAKLLYIVSQQISKMGHQNLMMSNLAKVLHENLMFLISAAEELMASATQVGEMQKTLYNEIDNVSSASEQIVSVSDAINYVVDDINLLGFNATIEAARVGSIGSGFAVVAKEIRKLSFDSKNTLSKINFYTESIKTAVNNTVKIGKETLESTNEQTDAICGMIKSIEELSEVAEKLKLVVV